MAKAPVVGFAGLTHLGICSGAAAAERGFEVVGFHPIKEELGAIKNGELPVSEPGLEDLLNRNLHRITYTANPNDLEACDIVYIAVDVPTNNEGVSDLKLIDDIISLVQRSIDENTILVILCQVPPGFTRQINRPPSLLFYQVETLIFGKAVERAQKPERFIVGCADPISQLPQHLCTFLSAFDCPILPMRYESAELAKISINMCLVASIGVANTLAEICENNGADWSEIIPSLRLDKRIGKHSYIEPGLGIAGGNL